MGQKVNPHGLRVGVIKNWDSRWYVNAKEMGDTIVSDYKIREYVKTKLQSAGVPKVEIERDSARVRVFIQCAKPGVVIGFHGAEIEKLTKKAENLKKTAAEAAEKVKSGTVEVAGMKEMLGENNEYGIVTENNEEALYEGIKSLLDNPDLLKNYKEKAVERGKFFSTEKTVKAVEDMILSL